MENTVKKTKTDQRVRVFDFDRTLTKNDTTRSFFLFLAKSGWQRIQVTATYYGLALLVKMGLIRPKVLKNILWLSLRLSPQTASVRDAYEPFAQTIEFSELYHSTDWWDAAWTTLVISASPEGYVRACFPDNVIVVGNKFGNEKRDWLIQNGYTTFEVGYSDSKNDWPMMSLAKKQIWVK